MLASLLARVQTYADERNLRMHRGTLKRTVYTAEDILDGQYMAIVIHFDRDRNALIERANEVEASWREVFEHKIDEIDNLEFVLRAYHEVYTNLRKIGHLDREYVLEALSSWHELQRCKIHFEELHEFYKQRCSPKAQEVFELYCDIDWLCDIECEY